MGGCIGFLKTLRRLVADIQPTDVFIAWESGGSKRRRAIFSEYKLGRSPERLNRFYEDDIPESDENRKYQISVLLAMLKASPVCQLYVPDCEGDDVISYLCCGPFRDREKIIVSSDRDFYQLLNDKTMIYSLHKKNFVTKDTVLEEFRVLAENFAIAKALCGDASDNIPGIKGLGFKTVAKLFPFLATTERAIILQDVIDYSHSHIDECKKFREIVEHEPEIRRNWDLVFLNGNMLSASQIQKIDEMIATYVPQTDRIKMMKLFLKEGIDDFDVPMFMQAFNCVLASREKK